MSESSQMQEAAGLIGVPMTTDPQKFEERLDARTRVPASRIDAYINWDDGQLERECEDSARVLRRFAEAVVASVENPASADEFLRALDLKAISRDHDWRAIFSTIRAQHGEADQYKRAVLVKYLQYLGFRKRLLEFICARRRGLDATDEMTEAVVLSRATGDADHFARLPLGEPVDLELRDGGKIELMLAGHLYRLIGAHPPCILDQNGVMSFLRPGRNLIGRHPESDVVVDANFSDISRAHLIIEWRMPDHVRLQDLSTRGTMVQAGVLVHAKPALIL